MVIPNVSSSSFPSSSHQWNHDVFLSFRGEDTRNTFTGHLYNALIIKGINTFRDDVDLQKGDEISPALLEAIEQSKFSIIVFSKNYATSTWCLDELVKILECQKSIGQMVQPIFYDVDPSDMRKQLGEVMDMHEKKFKDDIQRVLRWKVALKEAANLSGWHLNNGNKLHMHDVIQLMGRNIVHQESPNELGKRSRLWSHEDILRVLMENTGTYNAIQGIKLDLFGQKDILLNPSAFTRMKRLRLLIIRHARFSEGPKSLSNELILLDWDGYPSPSLSSNFLPQKLVTLNMRHSKIKQFKRIKVCENLRKINFCFCKYLTCIPDVSMMANLESLNVEGCCNLVEVHRSVGNLTELSFLDVTYCSKLRRLPNLKLPRLQYLELEECTSFEKFPNIVGEIPLLSFISIDNSPIQELPLSVEYLIGLEFISIVSCKNLRDLPRSICKLPRLKNLWISHCTNLGRFPKSSSSSSTNLGWLASSKRNKTQDMSLSVGWFPTLKRLNISYCNLAEVDFLKSLHCLSTLEELHLSGNNFISLPASCITRFTHLQSLVLNDCKGLRQKNASSGGKSFIDNLTMMIPILYRSCGKMITTIKIRGGELPEWFRHQTRENGMCFRVPLPKNAKLAGLVVGIVLKRQEGSEPGPPYCLNLKFSIINNGRQLAPVAYPLSRGYRLESDGVLWLLCLPRGALKWWDEITNEGDHFGVSFQCDVFPGTVVDKDKCNKRLGVHFVFEQDDNMDDNDDDDPRVVQHYCSPNNMNKIVLENDNCCQPQQQLAEEQALTHCGGPGYIFDS
ncbi:hypothetical protein I3843_09G111300 [Carya illinoinensis]|nr:hypothetical protein I3843_09G111300 [Carya illinoinensis]